MLGGILVLMLGTSTTAGKNEGQDRQAVTPEQQYRALLKEYEGAVQEYDKAFREASTPEARQKAIQEKYPERDRYAAKILALVEKNAEAPFAEEALIWIVAGDDRRWRFRPWYEHRGRYEQIWIATRGGRPFGVPGKEEQVIRSRVIDLLLRDHVASAGLGRVVELLGTSQDKESESLLRAILTKNPSKEVKARAAMALAMQMQARVAIVKQIKDSPPFVKSVAQVHGQDYALEQRKADPVLLEAEARKFYAELTERYLPDMKPGSIAIVCQQLYYTHDSEMLLRALYTGDARDEVRGVACLVLAQVLMRDAAGLATRDARGAAKMHAEAEKLLEEAAGKYADVRTAFDGTVGRKARSELFDLHFLAVGKPAPEVRGVDQEGKEFRLSDYKGKVVLLDFWSEF
jgi:hypothetical protein